MRWAPGLVAVAAGAVLVLRGVPEASDPWRPGRGFAVAAEAVRDATPAGRKVVVLGEPALVFSLRNLGVDADHVDRLTGVDTHVPAGQPFVLVLGRYGRVVGRTQAWIDAHPAAVPETGRVAVDLGGVTDVRLLDDFRPYAAREVRRSGERPYELVLRSGTSPLGFE